MERRRLGGTDMDVSWLGFGAARIATDTGSPAEARRLLNALLDQGVNYIDTADCYGESEETLGEYISHRRDEYWLTTKCGHAAGEVTAPEWTAEAVTQGIDQSLRRMRTDYLDLVHIHTCEVDVLRQGDVLRALQDAPASRQDALHRLQRRQRRGAGSHWHGGVCHLAHVVQRGRSERIG